MGIRRCSSSNHEERWQRRLRSGPSWPGGRHGRIPGCSQDPGGSPRQCSWRPCGSGSYSGDRYASPPSVGEHSSRGRRPARELPRGGSVHPGRGERCEGCEKSKRHDHSGGSGGDAERCQRRNGRWGNHSWGKQSPPAKGKLATMLRRIQN